MAVVYGSHAIWEDSVGTASSLKTSDFAKDEETETEEDAL